MRHALFLSLLLSPIAGCASSELVADAPPAEPEGDAPVAQQTSDGNGEKPKEAERKGVLVPAEYEAISLWPEAYGGDLLVLEVTPHGTRVEQGEVIAQLDERKLEEQIRDKELELRSAELQHASLQEKNEMATEAAAAKLERAEASLARARRSLEGFLEQELVFAQRGDDLARLRDQHRVEDQVDELAQLEAMYEADELTDATEEIVLRRSRRDLAWTQEWNGLSEDRRLHRVGLTEKLQADAREEGVRKEAFELAHLVRTQELEARGREDAERRSVAALQKKTEGLERLQRDLELLTIRAPRAGTLLHGKAKDYRGGVPPRLARGSKIAPRADCLLVADPGALAVALAIPESALSKLGDGARVRVCPTVRPDVELAGTLAVADLPSAQKGDEASFEATVSLDGRAQDLVVGMHVVVLPEGGEE